MRTSEMARRVAVMHMAGGSEEYMDYFRGKMEKWGIDSPADLKSDEEKKKFFEEVDKGWTAGKGETKKEASARKAAVRTAVQLSPFTDAVARAWSQYRKYQRHPAMVRAVKEFDLVDAAMAYDEAVNRAMADMG